jgi:hypothetical protein
MQDREDQAVEAFRIDNIFQKFYSIFLSHIKLGWNVACWPFPDPESMISLQVLKPSIPEA